MVVGEKTSEEYTDHFDVTIEASGTPSKMNVLKVRHLESIGSFSYFSHKIEGNCVQIMEGLILRVFFLWQNLSKN